MIRPVVKFGKIFERVDRSFELKDDEEYYCVGVRWYGHGAFVRERLTGMQIKRKQQWRIHMGDIVYNKLFAWKGSFAVADESVNGRIVSDKFPTYRPDHDKVDVSYLKWFFRTEQVASQAQRLSKGAAAISKLTLNPPQFWELEIPLPPLEEQRRIVAKIERLAVKIDEARGLRQRAIAEIDLLLQRGIEGFADLDQYNWMPLERVLREPSRNGLSARPNDQPPGLPILRISAGTSRRDAVVDEADYKYLKVTENEVRSYKLEPRDLLACRFNGNLHFVGRFSLFRGERQGTILYPDKLIRFRVSPEVVMPEYVRFAMNSPSVRETIESHCQTTAGNLGISARKLSTVPLPVPSIEEQRRIVAYLDSLQAKVDRLKALQAQTRAELDALLPSILDRAFKGEL